MSILFLNAILSCSSVLVNILILWFCSVFFGRSCRSIIKSFLGSCFNLFINSSIPFLRNSFKSFKFINILLSISTDDCSSIKGVLPSFDNCSIILSFVMGEVEACSTVFPSTFTSLSRYFIVRTEFVPTESGMCFIYGNVGSSADGGVYINNGKFDSTFTGMVYDSGDWCYVKNGKFDSSYVGMYE